MALNDKMVAILDTSVPVKERHVEVRATAPGGVVVLETFGDNHIKIVERTRSGREKSAVFLARDHVVVVKDIRAK